MLELPLVEIIIFVSVVVLYLAASIIGIIQLSSSGGKYQRLLLPVVSLAVCLEAVLLIFRAIEIKAIPLTGLFESLIVLTIVFGLMFLFFCIAIKQVWFGSIMAWVIFLITLLAGIVAKPAAVPLAVAATPWAIAHGIAMVLSGAAIVFATANSFLYLYSIRRLKQKKVIKVLGRVPNVEELKKLNLFGLNACFVLMTFGLVSGFGLAEVKAASIHINFIDWLTDSKIVLIVASWILLAGILFLRHLVGLKDKMTAYLTMAIFFMILFAIIGTAVFCSTKHDFTKDNRQAIELREQPD